MKALVSHSGGVDSTTCLAMAVEKYGAENVSTVSFVYGQKLVRELESADALAKHYNVKHYVLDLSEAFRFSDCALLTDSGKAIIHESYETQMKTKGNEAITSYVPFRNGLFLSAVSCVALSIYPDEEVEVYIGAQANDSINNTYADCSVDFVQAMDKAIRLGTYDKVRLVAPIVGLSKAKVIETGLKLNVPYKLTWTCYEGGEKPCGKCAACIDRVAAFHANGMSDPVEYRKSE